MEETKDKVKKCPVPLWKRAGYIGFWFFMIKGLLWLAGFVAAYIWGPDVFKQIKSFFLA